MPASRTLTALALTCAAAGPAACGADDPSSGGGGPDAKTRQAMLAYARCMRGHGVAMDDPQFGADGRVTLKGGSPDETPEEQKAAERACAHYQAQIKPPELSAADRSRQRKEALAHARCMRSHGIDLPDPQFTDDGGITQHIGRGSGIHPDDADFKAAEKACGGPGGGLSRTAGDQ